MYIFKNITSEFSEAERNIQYGITIVCYTPFFFLIAFAYPKNRLVQFHADQGLSFLICTTIEWTIWSMFPETFFGKLFYILYLIHFTMRLIAIIGQAMRKAFKFNFILPIHLFLKDNI